MPFGRPSHRSSDSINDTNHNIQLEEEDEVLPLYDFANGLRGKHAQAYQRGHRVLIHKRDGTTEVQEFTLPEGAVVLDPDLRRYFPDAESVNRTLWDLIRLITQPHLPQETSI